MIPVNHPFETKAVLCVSDIVKSQGVGLQVAEPAKLF